MHTNNLINGCLCADKTPRAIAKRKQVEALYHSEYAKLNNMPFRYYIWYKLCYFYRTICYLIRYKYSYVLFYHIKHLYEILNVCFGFR